jgi:hypothetical protein
MDRGVLPVYDSLEALESGGEELVRFDYLACLMHALPARLGGRPYANCFEEARNGIVVEDGHVVGLSIDFPLLEEYHDPELGLPSRALVWLELLVNLRTGSADEYVPLAGLPLDALPQLRYLRIVDAHLDTLEPLIPLAGLETLAIVDGDTKTIDVAPLAKLTALERLVLSRNFAMHVEHLGELSALPSLTHLDLGHNSLAQAPGLERLEGLRHLDLSDNRFEQVVGLYHLTDLRHLDLSDNRLSTLRFPLDADDGHVVSPFGRMTALRHLDVSENDLRFLRNPPEEPRLAADAELEAVSGTLPELRTLDVSDNHLEALPPVEAFPRLESLDASDNYMQDTSGYSAIATTNFESQSNWDLVSAGSSVRTGSSRGSSGGRSGWSSGSYGYGK